MGRFGVCEVELQIESIAPAWRRRIWLVAAVSFVYLLILHFLRDQPYLEVLGLAFEYGIILPAVLWYLHGLRGAGIGSLSMPRVALATGLAVLAVCVPVAWHEYRSPANPVDESCYEFQARIFETGHVTAASLPGATADVRETPAELDYQNHVLTERGWFTHFPPGWPLVLVVGDWVGLPWLLNPLLAVALLAVTFYIAKHTFSNAAAQLAVVFTAFSPFFLAHGVRVLSHLLCALLAAAACLLVFRGMQEKRVAPFAWAFALLAFALHVRPYSAAAEAAVLGVAALWYTRDERKLCEQIATAGAVLGGLGAASTMLYYYLCTGNPLLSPYAARVGADLPSELTFNPRLIAYFTHRFGQGTLEDTLFSVFPFVFLLAVYAVVKERERVREVRILAGLFAVLILAYLFHTEKSYSFYGSRFHFEGFFAVTILAARGLELLARRWMLPSRAVLAVVLLLGATQIAKEKGMVASVWRAGGPYHRIAAAAAEQKAPLVFLKSGQGYNARFMNFNEGDWRHAPTVYLIDADPAKRDEWACRFGRPDWVVIGLDANGKATAERGRSECGGKF